MSEYIGDLLTVNGGKVMNWKEFSAEIMGGEYSTHRTNLVAVYAKEGQLKVELVYDGVEEAFYIYKFKGFKDTQHYWSTQRSKSWVLNSPKYKRMGMACIKAYKDIFGKA